MTKHTVALTLAPILAAAVVAVALVPRHAAAQPSAKQLRGPGPAAPITSVTETCKNLMSNTIGFDCRVVISTASPTNQCTLAFHSIVDANAAFNEIRDTSGQTSQVVMCEIDGVMTGPFFLDTAANTTTGYGTTTRHYAFSF